MNNKSLIRKYDKQAAMYEHNTRRGMLGAWRQRLLSDVSGRVLEVAVGTGANFPYYRRDAVEITGIDFSPAMLSGAKRIAAETGIQATLLEGDVEQAEFPERSFDCVVSTLSLCGYEQPLEVVNRLNRWCRKGGSLYFLEHGISSNPVLRLVQHAANPIARRTAGCHFNRNIVDIIQSSEAEVIKIERYWNGIFHLIWARST